MIVALIPAHNEETRLPLCLDALLGQTRPPDMVVVVADNCSDGTERIAAEYGVEVYRTRDNDAKKAGGLNQALAALRLSGDIEPEDTVLVLDADSILAPDFLATAERYLADGYAGVGGNFRGDAGAGLIGMFQRNEYARYARDVARLKGKALVLTGTATAFRYGALLEVARARGHALPGEYGLIYDTAVLTEDNEMTFALRTLGHRVISPKGCTLLTEVMPTLRDLARQRLRWKRGAFENLRQYGLNRLTAPYWSRQVMSFLGILTMVAYFASLVLGVMAGMHLHPFWIALSGVFAVERAVTVRERGWRQMLIALALIPESVYDVYLQAVQAYAYACAAINRKEGW